MPGTNGEGRVGGCAALGVDGGRAGTEGGADSGVTGGGGALAIGRRPEHPAKSKAAKNGAIHHFERRCNTGHTEESSLNPVTIIFEQLQ